MPGESFEEWLERTASMYLPFGTENPSVPSWPTFDGWRASIVQAKGHALLDLAFPETQEEYLKALKELLKSQGLQHRPLVLGRNANTVGISIDDFDSSDELGSVTIENGVSYARGVRVQNLDVSQNSSRVILQDCYIRHLRLNSNNLYLLSIIGCRIGKLELGGNFRVFHFHLQDTQIKCFEATGLNDNPFNGRVRIEGSVEVPLFKTLQMDDAVSYLICRGYLLERGQDQAAAFFTRAFFYFKYPDEAPTEKFISWMYWAVSDYGASLKRPFFLFVWVVFTSIAFAYLCDPILHVSELPKDFSATWQGELNDSGLWARFLRAATVTISSFLNPFDIFGGKTLVSMPNAISNVLLKILGATGLLVATMFVIGVRRRFKLEK